MDDRLYGRSIFFIGDKMVPNVNPGAYASAMAGYKSPTSTSATSSNPSALSGILDTVLQLGGMMAGEAVGGPMGAALGSGGGTALGELLSGQGLNPAAIGTGALYGLMPGMLGGKAAEAGALAASDLASTVGPDLTSTAAEDATAQAAQDTATKTAQGLSASNQNSPTLASTVGTEPTPNPTSAPNFIVDPTGTAYSTSNPNVAPTNIDPLTNQGHINLLTNPETGAVTVDPNNMSTAINPIPPSVPENPYIFPGTNSLNINQLDQSALDRFAQQGYTSITDRYGNTLPLQAKADPNAGKLNSLNPTGGLLVNYTPQDRASLPLGNDMTTLDKTSGTAPNTPTTIYRGAPTSQSSIVPGDFVTTNKDLAQSYAGEGNVLQSQVPASHILDSKTEPLGEEYIYRPPAESTLSPKATIPPEKTPINTSNATSPTDTFTQAKLSPDQKLNPIQRATKDLALTNLKEEVMRGGSGLSPAGATKVAQNLYEQAYPNLAQAAQDANPVVNILSNGINDHINNAEINGSTIDLQDYNNIARKNIHDAKLSGVITARQEDAAMKTLDGVGTMAAGDGGSLAHVLPSDNLKAVRELGNKADRQFRIAQGRGISSEGATQLGHLYTNMGKDLMERGFGVANGNAPVSDANIENMINQVQNASFNNPTYQQSLIKSLEDGKGGNLSLQNLRSLMANHVAYSKAANPDQIGNLTNSLMAAGLSKSGITSALINSSAGKTLQNKAFMALNKLFTPKDAGAITDAVDSGASNIKTGGKTMSPIGRIAKLAGIIGALGLAGDTAVTLNQGSNSAALLNSPEYKQTQALTNQSNALQRYLGQMGEIRSIFAPTFDSNAAQAGTMGATMLANANQNQAANTATNNLLTARSQMGPGGILGGILSLIPGTPENTYAKQAANAQAQLNALGIAGTAPTVTQSGGSIPALTSMAGNIGRF